MPEASLSVTCDGFTFPSAETAVFLDASSGLPSDIVILANNAAGVATILFVSDNLDVLPTTTPVGSLITLTEPQAFVAVGISTTGISNSLLTFTSDADNGTSTACGASDCMTASAVPEPATMGLLGSGWIQRRRRQRQVAA